MRNKTKKTLFVTLATMSLSLLATGFAISSEVASAAETVEVPSGTINQVEKDAGFTLLDGASVRISTSGIRWTTQVTKAYYDALVAQGDTEFLATVEKENGATIAMEFSIQPTFAATAADTDVYTMYTYLNFDQYEEENAADAVVLRTAYATNFVSESYAKVTKADNSVVYYQAYKADDSARSMQTVANAAYLDTNESDLLHYFTQMDYAEEDNAYALLTDGTGEWTLPALTGDTYTGAYIGTKKISTAINGNKITLSVDKTDKKAGDTEYVSAFTASGKVVTRKLVFADKAITASNVADLLTATSGYIVIAEDIDMATAYTANNGVWTDVNTHNFVGTINGLNHKISNFKTSTGLVYNFNGTFENLAFVDVATTVNSGIICYGYQRSGVSNVAINNVYANVSSRGGDWAGLVGYVNSLSSLITFTDCIMIGDAEEVGYMGRTNGGIASLKFNNCYAVNAVVVMQGNNPGRTETSDGVSRYTNAAGFADAYLDGKVAGISDFVMDLAAAKANIVLINSKNIATLLSATNGTYVLTEDIDMSKAYTENEGVWTSAVTLSSATVDGMGYTISNFKTSTGLFAKFNGTVKNIAFVNAKTTGEAHIGLIAKEYDHNGVATSIDNVYASISCDSWSAGLFIGYNNRTVSAVTFNNCVVEGKTASVGYFGKLNAVQGTLSFTNCYAINAVACTSGNMTGLDASALKVFANLAAMQTAYDAGTVTGLSDFVLNKAGIQKPTAVSEYSIVVSNNASAVEKQSAEILQDFFMKQQA